MTKEQRTAMARVVSDMIKADNIIEESEIRFMKELMERYSLKQHDMSDARNMRFSDAVNILQGLKPKEKRRFIDSIYNMALSDNACVAKEILLLIALEYCLIENNYMSIPGKRRLKPYLISCPIGEVSVEDQYMVYIERSYDEKCNTEICDKFELLVSKSRLYGFHFVYIPKMIEEFKGMDSTYVKDVIGYMSPNLSTDVVDGIYERLCGMTTSSFYQNVLYEKLHVQAIRNDTPYLLLNIGTSVVPYCAADGKVQYYTEFLCLPIIDSVLDLVSRILDFYKNKISIQTTVVTGNNGQFKYFGFYKALFDFLVAPPSVAPDLFFLGQDMKTGRYCVAFKFDEGRERVLKLPPSRYNLFFEIAFRTYSPIYASTPGLPVSHVNMPSLSHLKKSIADTLIDNSYVELYKPERNGNTYILGLDKSKVFVRHFDIIKGHYVDIPIKDYSKQ